MAKGLQINDLVFVPTSTTEKQVQSPSAFSKQEYLRLADRVHGPAYSCPLSPLQPYRRTFRF